MKKKKVFKKGTPVMVIRDGENASKFNASKYAISGIYAISDWDEKIFKIEGTVQLVSFDHNADIFCAYLLSLHGNHVGFVYNTAIKETIEEEQPICTIDGVGYSESTLKSIIKKAHDC